MNRRPHILITFGTRPEAIKLAPLIIALQAEPLFEVTTCVTAQHRELLDDALAVFSLEPDLDLDLMMPDQNLSALTARILGRMKEVLDSTNPDLVVVQGDTTTAMAAALASHYAGVPVAHVEAGLRTGELSDPWPEEANRRVIARLAALHFAPTETSRENLVGEGISPQFIEVTGNTGVDAIELVEPRDPGLTPGTILVTTHRRENQADEFRAVGQLLRTLSGEFVDREFLLPLHPSPKVREPIRCQLGDLSNVSLVPPLDYPSMLGAIRSAAAVVTDSGGVQEEAAYFSVGCVVIRPRTDRPEAVTAGLAQVVGHDAAAAVDALRRFQHEPRGRKPRTTFGDGYASRRIVERLRSHFDT